MTDRRVFIIYIIYLHLITFKNVTLTLFILKFKNYLEKKWKKNVRDFFLIFKSLVTINNPRTSTLFNYSLLGLFEGTFEIAGNVKIEFPF